MIMEAPAAPPAPIVYIIPSAEDVGNAFARQYYTILEQSPGLVYRFYQDISKMGRVDDGGTMSSTTTMDAINQKIQSYGSLRADINFVDAQESYSGGVIVLVTGCMTDDNHSKRGFTQTFFLAPQDRGYYVLNDIFRYVDDDPHTNEQQNGGIAPSLQNQDETPAVQESIISEQSNGEVYNPCENGEVPVEEEQPEEELQPEEEVQPEEEEPVAEVVDEAPPEAVVVVKSNVKLEPPPKKSYASIVMKEAPVTVPSPTPSKSVPKMQEQRMSVAPAPSPVAVPLSSNAEITDDGNNQQSEAGDGYSIYTRNLPSYATAPMIEEVFQQFGPVKSGGIQIKNKMGFMYGFVAFETADAAQSAIEASFVMIDGRKATIEEKKSTTPRGNNPGRYPSGRSGNGFRGEGGRGHGGYGGGRSYGRGESNKNDYGGRGGGRGYQNRSDGYQRSDQTGNGFGRVNRGGGPTRAPKVSAQA